MVSLFSAFRMGRHMTCIFFLTSEAPWYKTENSHNTQIQILAYPPTYTFMPNSIWDISRLFLPFHFCHYYSCPASWLFLSSLTWNIAEAFCWTARFKLCLLQPVVCFRWLVYAFHFLHHATTVWHWSLAFLPPKPSIEQSTRWRRI